MIQTLERAARILNCFEKESRLGITEIARQTGLTKSTAFGLISTLAALGYLEQDKSTGQYMLGLELFRLGNKVEAGGRRAVDNELDKLVEELGETINYVRRQGRDVIYIAKKESPHSMRISTTVGLRLPMYCTAVGKAILAFLPEEEQDRIIEAMDLRPLTSHTVTDRARLREELSAIRKQGYAVDHEELEYGLVCVAVPIPDSQGYTSAAISCSGPASRMTRSAIASCRARLLESASRLASLYF